MEPNFIRVMVCLIRFLEPLSLISTGTKLVILNRSSYIALYFFLPSHFGENKLDVQCKVLLYLCLFLVNLKHICIESHSSMNK